MVNAINEYIKVQTLEEKANIMKGAQGYTRQMNPICFKRKLHILLLLISDSNFFQLS